MNRTLPGFLIGAGLLALPGLQHGQAAVAAHYPAGVEGIKGSSLPPAGIYFRDYSIFYTADRYLDGPPEFDIFACINAPRLIWMTDWKVLGADYGMDLIVPFGYMNWEVGVPGATTKDSYFGIGDIQIEPILLSWHLDRVDLAVGYAVWAPTGDFSPTRPDLLAKGFWSHMLTFGVTWHLDAAKTWALSLLNRYEICYEQEQTDIDPGDVYTLEWALSKSLSKTLDVGLVGYWQEQTTDDDGAFGSPLQDRKLGVGAEVSGLCPKLGMLASLRYVYEFDAVDRPEGHLLNLTLTKRF